MLKHSDFFALVVRMLRNKGLRSESLGSLRSIPTPPDLPRRRNKNRDRKHWLHGGLGLTCRVLLLGSLLLMVLGRGYGLSSSPVAVAISAIASPPVLLHPQGVEHTVADKPAGTSPEPTSTPPLPTATAILSNPYPMAPFAATMIEAEREAIAGLDDPTLYTIDVALDWQRLKVSGTEQVLYTNNETVPLNELYLRLYPNAEHYVEGDLSIQGILVAGQPSYFEMEGTVLKVDLGEPLAPEAQVELTIDFLVSVPYRDDRFGYAQRVMTLGHWYPIMAVYDDEGWNLDPYVEIGDAFYSEVSLYTLRITVPEDMVVVTSGLLAESLPREDGTVILTYYSGAMRDFALALSPDYRSVSETVGETTVNSYYLIGDEEGGEDALRYAVDALQLYNELFGPYPYTELDVAETYFTVDGSPGGMEFPGLVFVSTDFYQPSIFQAEQDTVVAHEVGHQWWYGVVGNNQVDEPWLDESFATYSSILYYEFAQGEEAAQQQMLVQGELPYQMMVLAGLDAPINSSLLEFDDFLQYLAIVYSKGALFLQELRRAAGDETFFNILRHYYQEHKYGLARPEDFRRAIEEVSARVELAELYDRWVLRAEGAEGLEGLKGFGPLLESLFEMGGLESVAPEELQGMLEGLEGLEELGPLLELFLGSGMESVDPEELQGMLEGLEGLEELGPLLELFLGSGMESVDPEELQRVMEELLKELEGLGY